MEGWAGSVMGRPAVKQLVPHFLLGCSERSENGEIDAKGEEGAPAKLTVEVRGTLYRGRWCGVGSRNLMN